MMLLMPLECLARHSFWLASISDIIKTVVLLSLEWQPPPTQTGWHMWLSIARVGVIPACVQNIHILWLSIGHNVGPILSELWYTKHSRYKLLSVSLKFPFAVGCIQLTGVYLVVNVKIDSRRAQVGALFDTTFGHVICLESPKEHLWNLNSPTTSLS